MRIGEVAAATKLTTKTLRFYEARGLLPASDRAANGYREYAEDTLTRLDFIRRSRLAGLTLAEIGEILRIRDVGQAPCAHVRDLLAHQVTQLDRQIAKLVALRATVAEFHAAAVESNPVECDPNRICSLL